MTSKISIDNRELLQKISIGEAAAGIDFGNAIVRELAAFRLAAMDSKPVAEVVSVFGDSESIGERELKLLVGIQNMPYGTKFYRHAQPASETEREPIAWLNDAYLARGVVDGEAGSEDAGPGYIPVYREASPAQPAQPAPVVPDENVSFHHLPGESEYDRLNRQREWMESKSKLAKVTAAAQDDLTERLLRLRAQATLDGSYLDTDEWDSLACDVIKALNACRAAMLQGKAEPVSLHPELSVWYGSMPESNGKSNWTTILHRKGECLSTGITIELSEYPERVRYEADRVRHIIGELKEEPDILAYDADAHSGYVEPGNSPAIPDTWIPVSERMPEAEGHYLVLANASRIDGYCDHLAIATYQSGEWSNEFNWLVTHWMPLPAAPQEVKK